MPEADDKLVIEQRHIDAAMSWTPGEPEGLAEAFARFERSLSTPAEGVRFLRGVADWLDRVVTEPAHTHMADVPARLRALASTPSPDAAKAEGLLRDLAGIPCQTKSAEDLEPGCCGPCRARAHLSSARTTVPVDQVGLRANAAKRVIDALWPIFGGNHTDAETWREIADAVDAALTNDTTDEVTPPDKGSDEKTCRFVREWADDWRSSLPEQALSELESIVGIAALSPTLGISR